MYTHNKPKHVLIYILLIILLSMNISLAAENDMNKKVLAPTFIVVDADDPDTFIYAKKPDLKIMPASTTKIMTCILALENCPDLTAIVPVPDNAVKLKSTNTLMGLKRGESLPLIDLLYGMMLPSGNDAAITVATFISGSVEQFAELMNQKAAELHMDNTHFTNASGVYNGQHYSTARDMIKLAVYALKNDMFRKIVSTAEYDVPANEYRKSALHLVNTNRLVSDPVTSDFYYEYAIGCKTGSTEKGGKCLVAAAEKDGVTLVAVLLGVKDGGDKSTRIRRCFSDAKMMFKNIFETMYSTYSAESLGITPSEESIQVSNATKRGNENGILTCLTDLSNSNTVLSEKISSEIKNDLSKISKSVSWFDESLSAPINEGDILGTVTYSYNGHELFTVPLAASRNIAEHTADEDITPTPLPTDAPTNYPTSVPATPMPIVKVSESQPSACVYLLVLGFLTILIVIVFLMLLKSLKKCN